MSAAARRRRAAAPVTRPNTAAAAVAELEAIRAALAAAGIPAPFTRLGDGNTAAWVAVALAEVAGHRERIERGRAVAVERAATAKQEKAAVRAAAARIAARTSRPGCTRPDKAAYDPDDQHEMRIVEGRRRASMNFYRCKGPRGGCDWWHLGNPPSDEVVDAPALPDDPITWARAQRRVRLLTGTGEVHAEGLCVSYQAEPTVRVRTADGRVISWTAELARPVSDEERPELAG